MLPLRLLKRVTSFLKLHLKELNLLVTHSDLLFGVVTHMLGLFSTLLQPFLEIFDGDFLRLEVSLAL